MTDGRNGGGRKGGIMGNDSRPAEEADLEFGLIWDEHQQSFDVFLRFTQGLRVDMPLAPRETVSLDLERLRSLERDENAYAQELTNRIFAPDEIRRFYREAMAARASHVRLHFRLHLDAPDRYHSIRWELLRDPEHATASLATSQNVMLSRYLLSTEWQPVDEIPDGDLQALAVIAAPSNLAEYRPSGRNLADVDRDEEVAVASRALEKYSRRFLSNTGEANIKAITVELERGVDILYLVAHGAQTTGVPYLLLEGEDGKAELVDARHLEEVVRDLRRPPSLVFLNSCRSASAGDDAMTDDGGVLAALGPRLARAGVPAVIAMQDNVTMTTAREFASTFFGTFADDPVVDAAMATARGRVRERRDWWVPVLFSRLRSGRIRYPAGLLGGGNQAWNDLVAKAEAGELTPVLGPGLADGLIGSRRQIATNWARRWQMPLPHTATLDLAQVSQYLKVNSSAGRVPTEITKYLKTQLIERKQNARGEDPFVGVPDELITGDKPEQAILEAGAQARQSPNDPYRVIAALDSKIFVTTAWTGLLQDALRARRKEPFTLTFPWSPGFKQWKTDPSHKDWARSTSRQEPTIMAPLVYHMFGRLEEPRSLVLTQDDYFDWLTAWTETRNIKEIVPTRVLNAFAANSLLFLGYYLDDWDFRVVFQSIKAFALQPPNNQHIGVQVRPRGQIVEREAAQRYLDSYFDGDKISIFWMSTASFAEMLRDRLGLQT